ncbi:MAG: aldo/keto reductase [Rubrobacteraceae bacterium]
MERKKIKDQQVPSIGLGTWRLSGGACVEAVERALSMGYRHLDTAQMYGNENEVGRGMSNSGVGQADIFLVTKLSPGNFTRERALASARESLRKLGTEYVDLLLMHWPNPSVPLKETLGAMVELQEEGSVRHVGVSNFPAPMVEEATRYAEIFCNQVEYHPRKPQNELLKQARTLDYLLTAYSPVAKGRLADDATLKEIGGSHRKTPSQIALRWLIQQEKVCAIPKAQSREHQQSNLDLFDFELSEEELERISSLGR